MYTMWLPGILQIFWNIYSFPGISQLNTLIIYFSLGASIDRALDRGSTKCWILSIVLLDTSKSGSLISRTTERTITEAEIQITSLAQEELKSYDLTV